MRTASSLCLLRAFVALFAIVQLCGCHGPTGAEGASVLRIGATPVPHEALLRHIAPRLAEAGITVKTVVMQDYVQPNLRVASGDLDANFFQTAAYFDEFAQARKLDLVNLGSIHAEPFALYARKHKDINALPEGARVAVPADVSNQHRALALLARAHLIALPQGDALHGIRDIIANPRRLRFVPVEAAMMPRMLDDVDVAGINANFALAAGLRPAVDGLVVESAADGPFANIVAVRRADAARPAIVQLMAALRSESMRAFIAEQYQGAVVALF